MSRKSFGLLAFSVIAASFIPTLNAHAQTSDWQQWVNQNPAYDGADLPSSTPKSGSFYPSTSSSNTSIRKGAVRPLSAKIKAERIGDRVFRRIVGSVKNTTKLPVTNVVIYYEVKEGYSKSAALLDSGGFHIKSREAYYKLTGGGKMNFSFPIDVAGHLRLTRITWDYMDGTQGENTDTRTLNEYL